MSEATELASDLRVVIGQLVERVGWAVRDADQLEHENRLPMSTSNRPAK